jgi:glycosyltransferase involved in cell wall biosynthesis
MPANGFLMKTKVSLLIGSLQTGGAETQVVEMMNHLDRERFETSLILFAPRGLERAQPFVSKVKLLRNQEQRPTGPIKRAYYTVLSLKRLASHLNQIRPDILHAFLPEAGISAAGARFLGKVPCLVTSRLSLVDAYRPGRRALALADRIATRLSDFVVGNSAAIIDEVKKGGVPAERAQVIYNGVDVARFSPVNRPGWRSQFGWTNDNIVFGNVANFIPYKRHVDFVRAAALIRERLPQSRFLLVGEDRGEMPTVRNAIQEAGLSDYVQIISGTKTPELAFAAMDVYLCTSETEGLSNVLLEAMSSGVPVIATRVGGNPEAVADGFSGYIVPPLAPEQMAKCAIKLVTQPSLLQQLSAAARLRVEQTFSMLSMVRAHEDLYTRLLTKKRTSTWNRLAVKA